MDLLCPLGQLHDRQHAPYIVISVLHHDLTSCMVALYMISSNYIILYICRIDEIDFQKKKKPKDGEQKYGCNYESIQGRSRKRYTTSWGPVGFKKSNHPLAIMVCIVKA